MNRFPKLHSLDRYLAIITEDNLRRFIFMCSAAAGFVLGISIQLTYNIPAVSLIYFSFSALCIILYRFYRNKTAWPWPELILTGIFNTGGIFLAGPIGRIFPEPGAIILMLLIPYFMVGPWLGMGIFILTYIALIELTPPMLNEQILLDAYTATEPMLTKPYLRSFPFAVNFLALFIAFQVNRVIQANTTRARQRMEQIAETRQTILEQRALYLARIAHDLRYDILRIRVGLDNNEYDLRTLIKQMRLAEPDIRQLEEHIAADREDIEGRVDEIEYMIDLMLQTNQIQAGNKVLNTTTFNIADVCEHVLEEFNASFASKKITGRLERPAQALPVTTDLDLLRRIIKNLIGNAVKFTEHGVVTVRIAPQAAGYAIQIQDTGSGMSELALSSLRTSTGVISEGGPAKGAGLGLEFCKEAVGLLGGSIEFASTLRRGTTVTCVIPKG